MAPDSGAGVAISLGDKAKKAFGIVGVGDGEDAVSGSRGGEQRPGSTMLDCRLQVHPPMLIENLLSVRGRFELHNRSTQMHSPIHALVAHLPSQLLSHSSLISTNAKTGLRQILCCGKETWIQGTAYLCTPSIQIMTSHCGLASAIVAVTVPGLH